MLVYRLISKNVQNSGHRVSDMHWARAATVENGLMLKYIGRLQFLPRDEHGHLIDRCGEVVVDDQAVVIGNVSHATLRQSYVEMRDIQARMSGGAGLSDLDRTQIRDSMVDLELRGDVIYLRPIAGKPKLTFNADDLLQTVESKWKIKFTYLSEREVRRSIIRRGELWRISVPTQTYDEMKQWISENQFAFEDSPANFFKCITTGTRFITYENFSKLETLPPADLARILNTMMKMAREKNEHYNLELDLFMTDGAFDFLNQPVIDYVTLLETDGPQRLFEEYRFLLDGYFNSVDRQFVFDDFNNEEWVREMFLWLTNRRQESARDEVVSLDLSYEFRMHVQWLAGALLDQSAGGARIIVDPVFAEKARWIGTIRQRTPEQLEDFVRLSRICDEKTPHFIRFFHDKYRNARYINIANVVESLSIRRHAAGRRGVYISEVVLRESNAAAEAELRDEVIGPELSPYIGCLQVPVNGKPPPPPGSEAAPIVSILRMQKWDMYFRVEFERERDWERARIESLEYARYVEDRALACRQLGMRLVRHEHIRLSEDYYNTTVETHCHARPYIWGIATDKIEREYFRDSGFAMRFAELLGEAAAPNLIVNRYDADTRRINFDDGDEIMIIAPDHGGGIPKPIGIVVAEHTGSFNDLGMESLEDVAIQYADALTRRIQIIKDVFGGIPTYSLHQFAERFVEAFVRRFEEVRETCLQKRDALNCSFNHWPDGDSRNLRGRWFKALYRMDAADLKRIRMSILGNVRY
ncbi:MAG: hypothetical protein ABIH86_03810 [Planctomycetota bacterium]